MEDTATTRHFASQTDEATLLARMQAYDAAAFETCVRVHCNRLLLVAQRILGNEQDAQDALQDAFLSAFKGIGAFRGHSHLGTWLHRIVVNAALMRRRAQRRGHEKSIEDLLPHFGNGEHQVDPPVPWNSATENIAELQERRDLVRRCIDQLPESYRTVLLLRDIEELDTQEAAQLLDTTPGVVKIRLHRARQALRTLLNPYFQSEGS